MKLSTIFIMLFDILSASIVSHYTAHTPFCYSDHAVIRTFDLYGRRKQLVVNVNTLQTSIQDMVKTVGHPCKNSRYTRLLRESASAPYPLSNDGITHQSGKGIAITTDLCPSSKKGFENRLYEALIKKFKNPVPVTLFVTGKWIQKHKREFRQFVKWQQEDKLAITWGNHTYTHPYHPGKPYSHNFALTPGYDLRSDTLRLEKQLIKQGITPSVFFRFPGLVSDQRAISTIKELGLITIGSNAWLAIGQKIKPGSIILLHGNRNEPRGVKMFLDLLKRDEIKKLAPLSP